MIYKTRALNGNLSLSNDGQLSLFPIGTGGAFSKKLYQNNLLIIKGDNHLLVDCGTRTPEAVNNLGLPITAISNFLITHSHADHVGGLEEVILLGRYVAKRKPKIIITKEYQSILWNHSMRGGAALNERKNNRPLSFADYWDIFRPEKLEGFKRDTYRIQFGNLDIVIFRTMHFPDSAESWHDSAYSVGMIVDGKVFFTGDTRFDKSLIEEYLPHFPIQLILQDVQFYPGGVHAPFDDLKTLPESVRSKTLLMHYPDTYQNHNQKVVDAGYLGFLEQQTFYDLVV